MGEITSPSGDTMCRSCTPVGWRMSCDVGKATEGLENELWRRWTNWRKGWRMSRAHCYSHSRAHCPTFPTLPLRHNSFSNPSVTLPTSQLILQPFRCFTYATVHFQPFFRISYVTSSSLNSPGEPPMIVTDNYGSSIAALFTWTRTRASQSEAATTVRWHSGVEN